MRFSTMKNYGLAVMLGFGLVAAQGASAQSANCEYLIQNDWGGGATASVEITNTGSSALNGWGLSWTYEHSTVTNSWNANVSGDNPYTASDMGWNGSVQPGQTVSFGVQVASEGETEVPTLTGDLCEQPSSETSSSASSSTVSSAPQSSTSEAQSSSAPSACPSAGESCNWYGSHYPVCSTTVSGWGWEEGQSCVASATCNDQPEPYGVESDGEDCPESSSSSSSVSSAVSSSASSAVSSVSSSSASSVPSPGGLTSVELTEAMGIGWNLGNTLEAVGGETAWGNPQATPELIQAVKAAGFDTIRIPVAWSQFSDEANFVIDSAWMNRVEEVVNYALDADMYVMINMHWDGGWMQPTYDQQDYVNERMSTMWEQIAIHFRDYSDQLLFAGTNEVMVDGEYGTPTEENYTVQNGFNQIFVDTVRATGGANATRHLIVQGYNTNIDHTLNFVEIPQDTVADRLMMEVHYYDPYNFTLNESSNITQWGAIATDPSLTEDWANESYVDSQFERMQTRFVDQGVGVILGEYGVISRPNVSGHEEFRNYWNEYITQSAVNHGLVPVYWDNGYAGNGGFALFDRHSGAQIEPEIIELLVNALD